MTHATRVEFGLGPSRILVAYLVSIHAGAGAAVWLAVPAPWAMAISVAILGSLASGLRRHALRCSAHAVRHATVDFAEGTGSLDYASGLVARGSVTAGGFASARLVVIAVRLGRWPRGESLVIAPDAVSPGALRRLRARRRSLCAA